MISAKVETAVKIHTVNPKKKTTGDNPQWRCQLRDKASDYFWCTHCTVQTNKKVNCRGKKDKQPTTNTNINNNNKKKKPNPNRQFAQHEITTQIKPVTQNEQTDHKVIEVMT